MEGTRRTPGSLFAEGWTLDEVMLARRFWPTEQEFYLGGMRWVVFVPSGSTRADLVELKKAAAFLRAAQTGVRDGD